MEFCNAISANCPTVALSKRKWQNFSSLRYRFGNISLVRLLLDSGADRELLDAQGMSAADHAREKECITILGMMERATKQRTECTNRINC
jgi:hypothetical protein